MIRLFRPECPKPKELAAGNYKVPENKKALKVSAHEKCMYCESKISHIDHAHVEHIKPKAHGKYPHLEYTWTNLGYSCAICNGKKHDKYDGETPYIDPYTDDPEEHLTFHGWIVFPRNGSERGELTITDVALNRAELIEQRKDRIEGLLQAINACFRTQNQSLKEAALKSLAQEAASNKEYSLAVKFALRAQEVIT